MVSRALDMDGTCTGEHGVGLGKKSALVSEVGGDTIMVMVSTICILIVTTTSSMIYLYLTKPTSASAY